MPTYFLRNRNNKAAFKLIFCCSHFPFFYENTSRERYYCFLLLEMNNLLEFIFCELSTLIIWLAGVCLTRLIAIQIIADISSISVLTHFRSFSSNNYFPSKEFQYYSGNIVPFDLLVMWNYWSEGCRSFRFDPRADLVTIRFNQLQQILSIC